MKSFFKKIKAEALLCHIRRSSNGTKHAEANTTTQTNPEQKQTHSTKHTTNHN
jgi:hypothetical protein